MKSQRPQRALVAIGVSGLLAVFLYVGATLLGGILDPRYSQVRNSISQLTANGAPNWAVEAPLYGAYNLVLFAFSVAVYRATTGGRRLYGAAVVLFGIGAISGLGQVTFFRQDPGGIPVTAAGSGHIVLAAVSSILTFVAAILYGIAFRRDPGWRPLSWFSLAVAAALLLSAPAAAVVVATPYLGLFERITIGVFMLWVVVVSLYALRRSRSGTESRRVAFG